MCFFIKPPPPPPPSFSLALNSRERKIDMREGIQENFLSELNKNFSKNFPDEEEKIKLIVCRISSLSPREKNNFTKESSSFLPLHFQV